MVDDPAALRRWEGSQLDGWECDPVYKTPRELTESRGLQISNGTAVESLEGTGFRSSELCRSTGSEEGVAATRGWLASWHEAPDTPR